MTKREEQLIRDAAALWKDNALYLSGSGWRYVNGKQVLRAGNYRWGRQHMLPRGKVAGKIAVPYNAVAKKYEVDLHELGAELGFSDDSYRREYLRKRKLLPGGHGGAGHWRNR